MAPLSPPKTTTAAGASSSNTYKVSHGLFMRAMGLIYFAAIFSNYVQWPGLFGYDGEKEASTLPRFQRQCLPPRLSAFNFSVGCRNRFEQTQSPVVCDY